jgi:hypothetical protein
VFVPKHVRADQLMPAAVGRTGSSAPPEAGVGDGAGAAAVAAGTEAGCWRNR